jgi:hypothetical protein
MYKKICSGYLLESSHSKVRKADCRKVLYYCFLTTLNDVLLLVGLHAFSVKREGWLSGELGSIWKEEVAIYFKTLPHRSHERTQKKHTNPQQDSEGASEFSNEAGAETGTKKANIRKTKFGFVPAAFDLLHQIPGSLPSPFSEMVYPIFRNRQSMNSNLAGETYRWNDQYFSEFYLVSEISVIL